MPRRTDISKILVIGSGPIVIGQACEFDYSGAQACKVLRDDGFEVVLVNSNPATIMTDPGLADRTYVEPITPEFVEKVIAAEKPDALLPTLGSQTGLNCAARAADEGILDKHAVQLIGANRQAIHKAEDRTEFKEAMLRIGLDVPRSGIAHSWEEAKRVLDDVGLPVAIRPAYTLGGTGGGFADTLDAFETIAKRVHTARANLDNPSRPVGVFLLAGPSGVGKTETGLALADALYGGERNIVTINMSEYQEAHTVSSLKGSPPGYVGYGEDGVLTEAVRRRPYSVVLLDEVEKAHPDVMELFFQVFDKGVLEDGEGREIDFKNTVILLTSNVASDTIMKLCADPDTLPEPNALTEAIRPELLERFPAALLGRLVVVPYYPIVPEILRLIIRLQLDRIVDRVRANHRAELAYGDELVGAIEARCTEPESGARAVDHILTHSLLPEMSADLLSRMASGETFSRIDVGVAESGAVQFKIS